jgi:hypothetical protein
MKTASTALINFLNAAHAAKDSPIVFADRFTFTLAVGTVLAYTNADVPITYNGAARTIGRASKCRSSKPFSEKRRSFSAIGSKYATCQRRRLRLL